MTLAELNTMPPADFAARLDGVFSRGQATLDEIGHITWIRLQERVGGA